MLQNWKYYIFIISLLLVQPISLIPFNQQVDIHRFAQYFSTHLSFDHLELAYTQFSKKLSNHFQHLIRVSLPQQSQQVDDSVDLQILSGQLKGAVGCRCFLYLKILFSMIRG
jgi:hypothetical protein